MKLLPIETETLRGSSTQNVLRDDPKFAAGRIAVFQYATVAMFLFLISGFWDLQVRNPELYNELAERNRIKSLPIVAPRGKILDRDGRVIVDNHSSLSVLLSRENLKPEHLQTHRRRPQPRLRRSARRSSSATGAGPSTSRSSSSRN